VFYTRLMSLTLFREPTSQVNLRPRPSVKDSPNGQAGGKVRQINTSKETLPLDVLPLHRARGGVMTKIVSVYSNGLAVQRHYWPIGTATLRRQ